MVKGIINRGDNTASHNETLRNLGYTVEETPTTFIVEASEFVQNIDLSAGVLEGLKANRIVAEKKLFTYKTTFLFPNGKTYKSILAATQLEKVRKGLSALIAKPESDAVEGVSAVDVSDLL